MYIFIASAFHTMIGSENTIGKQEKRGSFRRTQSKARF